MSAKKWLALLFCAVLETATAVRAQSSEYAWALNGVEKGSPRPRLASRLAKMAYPLNGKSIDTERDFNVADKPIKRPLISKVFPEGPDIKFNDVIASTADPELAEQMRNLPTAIPEPRGFAFGGVGLILVGGYVSYRSHRRKNAGSWQSATHV